jgi:hypothetical protein
MILPILGGILSAFHGGQIKGGVNKSLKNILWTLPFTICAFIYLPIWSVPFTLLCLLKALGHGRFFRLWEPMLPESTPEKIEYLILWLYGKIPLPVYKVLGMSLVGIAACLGGVVAFGLINPWLGLVIALGGALKGLNLVLFNKDTAVREYADGCCAYSALWTACLMV